MILQLDPKGSFIKNGKFDQYEALKSVGVKAAVCYKKPVDNIPITQEDIRNNESDATLIIRALNTIFNDHTTPSEHQTISLELIGIPKILCMILNNEHQYTADERSLRYTEVEQNKYITPLESNLYKKWVLKFEKIITDKMYDFYLKYNKNEKMAKIAIHKIAQENARYMVSVFMPTTTTYTVPFIQLNKILCYMQNIIDNPQDDFEKAIVPSLIEFKNLCINKNVALTKNSVYELISENDDVKSDVLTKYPFIACYKGDNSLIYKNNKAVDLSLFANRNKFSGINSENEYGYNISYNNYESLACIAQEHRHRTIDLEIQIPNEFNFFIPPILEFDNSLKTEWISDFSQLMGLYPQGQLVKVNRLMSVKNMLKFVSQERACDMAQLEIEKVYTNDIIPTVYHELLKQNKNDLAETVKPYVKKLRCQYPGYHCPNPCRHPRIDRYV